MNTAIVVVAALTFVIHFIGTLSLSIRIVGLKTQMWSMSYAMFNIISILSRTANTLQAPLLAKYIETQIQQNKIADVTDFYLIIFVASLGTIAGGLFMPTFQKILTIAVTKYYQLNSFSKIIFSVFTPKAWRHIKQSLTWPPFQQLELLKNREGISVKVLVMNIVVSAIMTISVLACLYAGCLNPELRATASSMNGVINGASIVLGLLFVDPFIALFSDEVNLGKRPKIDFQRYVLFLIVARLAGTLLAQFLLFPFAQLVLLLIEAKFF